MSTFNQTLFQLRSVGVEATLRKRHGGGFEAGVGVKGDLDARGHDGTWNWEPVKARTTSVAEQRAKAALAKLITNAAERMKARASELLSRSEVLLAEAERLVAS